MRLPARPSSVDVEMREIAALYVEPQGVEHIGLIGDGKVIELAINWVQGAGFWRFWFHLWGESWRSAAGRQRGGTRGAKPRDNRQRACCGRVWKRYYIRANPTGLEGEQRIQNNVNRKMEVYTKLKGTRDTNITQDPAKSHFFDQLLRVTFPQDFLIGRVTNPTEPPPLREANALILWELYHIRIEARAAANTASGR
jgi:hypothetical protein